MKFGAASTSGFDLNSMKPFCAPVARTSSASCTTRPVRPSAIGAANTRAAYWPPLSRNESPLKRKLSNAPSDHPIGLIGERTVVPDSMPSLRVGKNSVTAADRSLYGWDRVPSRMSCETPSFWRPTLIRTFRPAGMLRARSFRVNSGGSMFSSLSTRPPASTATMRRAERSVDDESTSAHGADRGQVADLGPVHVGLAVGVDVVEERESQAGRTEPAGDDVPRKRVSRGLRARRVGGHAERDEPGDHRCDLHSTTREPSGARPRARIPSRASSRVRLPIADSPSLTTGSDRRGRCAPPTRAGRRSASRPATRSRQGACSARARGRTADSRRGPTAR